VTVLERLGAHAVGGYREGFSDAAREAVRLHLVDTVGAWIAGGWIAEGRAVLHFAPKWHPDEGGMLGRVALGCALARLSEIDDIHLSSAITPGAIVVPAALTLGASLGSEGAAVAEAIAAGYDLVTRLGAALDGPAILYRGIWPSYFAAPFGTAAVAARLLGLDDGQAAHALAIALAHASPSVGRQSGASMSRWLAIGNAARGGVAAALAAQEGFTGDLHFFDGDFFSGVYRLAPDRDALDGRAEERPAVTRTSFKPWCAARQTMAAAQAAREIVEEGVAPAEMSELTVGVPPPILKMVDHGIVPGDRTSCLTSIPYQMALAALDPNATVSLAQAPEGVPEELKGFMAKISVKADEDLLQHYPRSWGARLTVATSSGKREKLVLHVPGDPERPFDELQVAAKFWRLTTRILGERAAENLLRRCLAALDEGPVALLEAIDGARSVV
jgi:2-methylcitrate dehydratase PrpD